MAAAYAWFKERRNAFEDDINAKLNKALAELEELKRRKLRQLEARLAHSNLAEPLKRARYQSGQQDMETIFTEYLQWIEDAMTTEDTPWVQVVAALVGNAVVSPTGSRRPLSPDEESLQCRHACFP